MMRLKISVGLLILLFSTTAFTADVLVKVIGNIKNESCTIKSNDDNQTITIGDFQIKDFPQVGSVSSTVPLNIRLENCTTAASGALVTFSGTAAQGDSTLLALSDTESSGNLATGVGVQILDADTTTPIVLNKEAPLKALGDDKILKYLLRYKSTSSDVTAGDATAIMYFDIIYL